MFYRSGHGIIRMFFLHIQALVRTVSHSPDRTLKSKLFFVVQYLLANLLVVCPGQHLVDIQHHH
jgi:hypothetical protein